MEKFLHVNKLAHMSRAHQLCMEGYQVLFRETFSTVWSAPNYCHRFGNLAAVMAVDEGLQVSSISNDDIHRHLSLTGLSLICNLAVI